MNDRFATEVRRAFAAAHEPSPGLADITIGGLRRGRPEARTGFRPLVAVAAVLVVVGIAVPVVLYALSGRLAGLAGIGSSTTALSLGSVTASGGTLFIARGTATDPGPPAPTHNALYQATAGAAGWQLRLRFDGIYDGMSFAPDGRSGVLWAFDDHPGGCAAGQGACSRPASYALSVFTTEDGGVHWLSHRPTAWPAQHTYFSGIEGWVVSRSEMGNLQAGIIYHTADGGATWEQVGLLPADVSATSWVSGVGETPLRFLDSRHGWFATGRAGSAGHSGLYQTTDGGKTWSELPLAAPAGLDRYDLFAKFPIFFPGGKGILPISARARGGADNATASRIYIYTTLDGGVTWTNPVLVGESPARAFAPVGDSWQGFFLDPEHWWISSTSATAGDRVQAAPALAVTGDGGSTWQVVRGSPQILVLEFSDPQHGWAEAVTGPFDENILLVTTDGGRHWTRPAIPSGGF